MYIRNLKYGHLTPIFQLHNIYFIFFTCLATQIKMDIVYRKTGFKRDFARYLWYKKYKII